MSHIVTHDPSTNSFLVHLPGKESVHTVKYEDAEDRDDARKSAQKHATALNIAGKVMKEAYHIPTWKHGSPSYKTKSDAIEHYKDWSGGTHPDEDGHEVKQLKEGKIMKSYATFIAEQIEIVEAWGEPASKILADLKGQRKVQDAKAGMKGDAVTVHKATKNYSGSQDTEDYGDEDASPNDADDKSSTTTHHASSKAGSTKVVVHNGHNIQPKQTFKGPGIPSRTTVKAVNPDGSLTLSKPASSTHNAAEHTAGKPLGRTVGSKSGANLKVADKGYKSYGFDVPHAVLTH